MIAKMRMQIGTTVISWGVLPELPAAQSRIAPKSAHTKFAVIEGGRAMAAACDSPPQLRAKSA